MTRILVVDDHPLMRQSLRELLEWEEDLTVCAEADSAGAALASIAADRPDVILIDVSLPGVSGIEFARSVHALHADLPFAMLTGHSERSHVIQAFEAGARGYILKGHSDEIARAVRIVAAGGRYVSSSAADPTSVQD